ncbi:MAG TPA: hypothetical protein IAB39_10565 [Candidatus Onthovicinus excrementipullorum]|nr:hypothetical protein [Candidatus Onthovicinus excrementipullorum]
MEREADYWEIFTHTGRVEDYLTYRRQARAAGKGGAHAPDHRRTDHPGTGGRGT